LQLIQKEQNGVVRLVVDSWDNDGIFHGFGNSTLNTKTGLQDWQKLTALAPSSLVLLQQIHSNLIIDVAKNTVESLLENRASADGWLIHKSKEIEKCSFGVMTADCVPVLAIDKTRSIGLALHCGWRGTVANLLPDALRLIGAAGFDLGSLELAIGPSAQSCCYEIGADVAQIFEDVAAAVKCEAPVVKKRENLLFGELKNLLIAQASSFGVSRQQIVVSDCCTICDPSFFSFRRQQAAAGRQVSFISL